MMCREIQMGVAAAQRAIADCGGLADADPDLVGVTFGVDHVTTEPDEFTKGIRACLRADAGIEPTFDFSQWGEKGLSQVNPLWLLKYLPNMPSSHVAIYNDFRGPSNSVTMREAACESVGRRSRVGDSARRGRRDGRRRNKHAASSAPAASTLRSKKSYTPPVIVHPNRGVVRLMTNGKGPSWRKGRQPSSWKRRTTPSGAVPMRGGEVVSSGSSAVATRRARGNLRQAIANAVANTLRRGNIPLPKLGHVQAHGMSTRRGDREESHALMDPTRRRRLLPLRPSKVIRGTWEPRVACLS